MLPDQPQQSSNGTTKRVGLSVDEAASRYAQAKKSAADGASQDVAKAAPTSEPVPDGLDPEVTNLDPEESDAGGSDDDGAAEAVAEDDSDGDSEAKDPAYRVKIDGEEYDVPLSELLRSYSFEASQRQKSQALAEQRRAVDSKVSEIDARVSALSVKEQALEAERERYDTALTALQEVFEEKEKAYANLDWRKLREEDPERFQELRLEYELHKEDKTKFDAEAKRRERERAQQDAERNKVATAAFQARMAKRFPQWADNGVMNKDLGEMHKLARKIGFSDDEFRTTIDDRIFGMLHMAMKFDRIEAAKASARTAAPKAPAKEPAKVVQPGGARPAVRAGNNSVKQAWDRLAKPGGDKIAAAAELLRARNRAAAG